MGDPCQVCTHHRRVIVGSCAPPLPLHYLSVSLNEVLPGYIFIGQCDERRFTKILLTLPCKVISNGIQLPNLDSCEYPAIKYFSPCIWTVVEDAKKYEGSCRVQRDELTNSHVVIIIVRNAALLIFSKYSLPEMKELYLKTKLYNEFNFLFK